MNSDHRHISRLLQKSLDGTLSQTELQELMILAKDQGQDHAFDATMLDQLAVFRVKDAQEITFWKNQLADIPGKIIADSKSGAKDITGTSTAPAHRVHFLKTAWFRYAAAILLLAGTAAYLWSVQRKPAQQALTNPEHLNKQFAAGSNKALLTLSDGSTIVLDTAANGSLALQGNTTIVKLNDGSLTYNPHNNSTSGELLYNTISTPRGGQYQLTLPDGTKAWLNAASSLTYPVAFTGDQRKVKVTGEAYFEVSKNSKPFLVNSGNVEVQVLGTQFNVNTYDDEENSKITLLEGSVRVVRQAGLEKGLKTIVLLPGQQAQVTYGGLALVNNADLDKTIAWKNGLFNFEDATLEEVMRQITRWYNIKVLYEKGIPRLQFWGKMSRNTSLPGLLKNLEDVGVHYRIVEEKRELIILP